MDPPERVPEDRKRKRSENLQQQQHSKCSIGRPLLVVSNQQALQCRLCHQTPVAIERSFGTSGGERTVLLVCGECSGILDGLDKFRQQALCSFRFLLDRRERGVRPRLCRFCFVTGDGLVDLFDGKGQVSVPKLLEQMRDWLEIVIDSRDAVTTLCRVCIRSVTAIATLRIDVSMDIVYLRPPGSGSTEGFRKKKVLKESQQERHDDRNEVELVKPGPSGNAKKKMKKAGQKRRVEANRNLLNLLQAPHEGRNFSILASDVDPTIQVLFGGHLFRLIRPIPSGTTFWKCVYHRLHHCPTQIEISPDGTFATLAKALSSHNHPAGPNRLLQHPQGRFLTTVNGRSEQPFYLTYGASGKSPYTRTLFLAGHRFYLMTIRTDGTGSKWCCNRCWDAACKVHLTVEGLFEEVKTANEHDHEPYQRACIERYLKECGVEPDSERKAAAKEERAVESAPKENVEQRIDATLTEPDQCRNFTVKQTSNLKVQITFNGHDFRWVDHPASGWCCIWRDIRRCPVRIQLSPDGRLASLVDSSGHGEQHNHPDEVISIFWHRLGKNVVFDEQESIEFHYRLFEARDQDSPNRLMEYQGYRYGLVRILDNGDSIWKCVRCEGTVRVMGLFWIVDYRCLHDHGPLALKELGNDKDLLAYKGMETSDSTPRSPSALLKLLSIDEPERNFQMHHRGDLMKILQDGYEYYYSCSKPTYSLWKCFYSTIRGCGATLHVDNRGRIGTPSPFSRHNHSIELWDLYYHRLGEGSILNESTTVREPFCFLIKPDFMRPLPHIIHQGHLLAMIFITEQGERSKWSCVAEGCVVTANVAGLFERISVEGLPHSDEPLEEEDRCQWIADYGTPDEF